MIFYVPGMVLIGRHSNTNIEVLLGKFRNEKNSSTWVNILKVNLRYKLIANKLFWGIIGVFTLSYSIL